MTTFTLDQEVRDILARAKKLPPEYREAVANALLLEDAREMESDADRAELKAELTRRWARLRSGEEKTKSIDEVIASLRRQNEARRA